MRFIFILFLFISCATKKHSHIHAESYEPIVVEYSESKEDVFRFPVKCGKLTSGFGMRDGRLHKGIDIAVVTGTDVINFMNGVVLSAGHSRTFGNYVIVKHLGYKTVYAHLSVLKVKSDQFVFSGEILALSGNTGFSTGPHLHFEVHKSGKPIDPLKLKYSDKVCD